VAELHDRYDDDDDDDDDLRDGIKKWDTSWNK
jgi:hypothetical protein